MSRFVMNRLSLALLHYPVKGKKGETIASAITNLDLHDIARAAKTYGVGTFYVVTPLEDQRALARKIVSHWKNGIGATSNPVRGRALDLVKIVPDISAVAGDLETRYRNGVAIVATSAAQKHGSIGFPALKNILAAPENKSTGFVLALGTAWGLTDEFMERANYILSPICGVSGYNHLSVRSAAAIMLDRLAGGGTKQ